MSNTIENEGRTGRMNTMLHAPAHRITSWIIEVSEFRYIRSTTPNLLHYLSLMQPFRREYKKRITKLLLARLLTLVTIGYPILWWLFPTHSYGFFHLRLRLIQYYQLQHRVSHTQELCTCTCNFIHKLFLHLPEAKEGLLLFSLLFISKDIIG